MDNSTQSSKKVAIITGASAGLGKDFARQVDHGFDLDEIWLLARRIEPMNELALELKRAKGIAISIDLRQGDQILALENRMQRENINLILLVNNAGYGKIGSFEEVGTNDQLEMIDLNVRSLTHLSKIALPFMKRNSGIIQVASSIGFAPSPFFTVYAATKAYVVSFSEALMMELKPRGIHVIAVCPGPVDTEFFTVAINASTESKPGFAKRVNSIFRAQSKDVVRKAIRDFHWKRRLSIYGIVINLFALTVPFIPRYILLRILSARKS